MIWYKDLYVGESIVHKTKKVKWKIMHNAGQIGIYVITLASNTQNLLDIIPSYELMQKGYPKKDMVVVGLAKGYICRPRLSCRKTGVRSVECQLYCSY